jgi:tryptophanyl-tRNA synthetase
LNHSSEPRDDRRQMKKITVSPQYATEVFTGIRPTGNLTVANYLGAVKPTTDLLQRGFRPLVFVADLHLFTTHEAKEATIFNSAVVADYIALGLDPGKADIFVKSDVRQEVFRYA